MGFRSLIFNFIIWGIESFVKTGGGILKSGDNVQAAIKGYLDTGMQGNFNLFPALYLGTANMGNVQTTQEDHLRL